MGGAMTSLVFDVNTSTTGGGGMGTVTQLNEGNGIALSPNPITVTGTISLAQVDSGFILANLNDGVNDLLPHPVTAVLDSVFGSDQGDVLYRSSGGWVVLAPGTVGNVLTTGGPAADPSWLPAGGAGGFPYLNARWVSQANGSDANTGTSIDTPLLTGQQAVNLAGTTPTVIYFVDANVNNTENIVTTGAGQYLIFDAPGTAFLGSITQADNDNLEIYAPIVNSLINNSTAVFVFRGFQIDNATTTAAGRSYIACSIYQGVHSGGGFVSINCNSLRGINIDATTTAFVSSITATSIVNVGTLNIFTTSFAADCITSNSGTIIGFVGGVLFGNAGVNDGSGSTANYSLPLIDGSPNYVLTTDGGGNVTWQPHGGSGSVTQVNTGIGLTGGPITTTGTVSFANITTGTILANISGGAAPPTPQTVSDVLDNVFSNTQGDILYRNSSLWTVLSPGVVGQILQTGGVGANPSWVDAEAAANHPYVDTQWVAQNGNDGSNGTSINAPKLTIQAAINALPSGGVINIEDNGTYTDILTLPSADIVINAPAATLNISSVTFTFPNNFIVNAFSFGVAGQNVIVSGGTAVINAQFVFGNYGTGAANPAGLYITADEIQGNFTFPMNISATLNFNILSGTIVDTGPLAGYPTVGIFGNSTNGNISSTNNRIYGNLPRTGTGTTISGVAFGNFGNQIDTIAGGYSDAVFIGGDLTVASQSVRTAVAGCLNNWALARGGELVNGYIFQMADSGKLFTYTGITNITVFGPSDATVPWLPAGWFVYIQQADLSGRVTVAGDPTGHGAIISSSGGTTTQGPGATVILNLIRGQNDAGTRYYGLTGNLSSFTTVNVYISQIMGNDLTGNGTLANQFATINAALTYVITNFTATPANGINLVITDNAVYNEKLDFTGTSNIQLIGRTAQIIYTSSGPGDNGFTSDSPAQFVSVGSLLTSGGGDSVDYSGIGALTINAVILGNGAINNNGSGLLIAQTYLLEGATSNTGGGRFEYNTIERTGVDGPGVDGNSADGSISWNVKGQLIASGLNYPLSDGSANDVMSTDGAGNLSLGPVKLPANGTLIYVSQQFGSSLYSGSFTNPLDTFGAAITLAGSPPPTAPVIIIGLDGNTYNEQLVLNNPNVYISAPYAQLTWGGAGDTLTINAASSGTLMDLGSVACTGGGNAIVNNNTETIIANVKILTQGDVVNSNTGLLVFDSYVIGVNLTNTSTGNIFYEAALRTGGTDSAGTYGINLTGSTFPSFTVNALIASGLNYPTVDGASGNILTTDGAGNLTLQPPAAAGISTINVQTLTTADTTYTPTVGMAYCIVEMVGGGGGGGGAAATVAGQSACGGGGGAGGYYRQIFTGATIGAGVPITIGAGGAGAASGNNTGTSGADSVFNSFHAVGGVGGGGGASSATAFFRNGSAGGGAAAGIASATGGHGGTGMNLGALNIAFGGVGGNSFFGQGGQAPANNNGNAGVGYGSGGSGGSSGSVNTSNVAASGGAGQDGICVVTEFIA